MKKVIVLCCFLIAAAISLDAQDQEKLEAFPQNWANALDQAQEKSDLSAYMKLFDRTLTFENHIVQVDGQILERNGDYFAFENQTLSFLSIPGVKFEISPGEINSVKIAGNVCFISFPVDFEAIANGKLVAKGSNMYNFVLTWKNNQWFATHMSSFSFREEMNIGPCPCNIQPSENNSYNVLTIVPTGVQLSKKQSNFTFAQGPDGKVIKSGTNTFMWYGSGRIVEVDGNGATIGDLGTVSGTEIDAIKQILKEGLYKGTCLSMTDMKL